MLYESNATLKGDRVVVELQVQGPNLTDLPGQRGTRMPARVLFICKPSFSFAIARPLPLTPAGSCRPAANASLQGFTNRKRSCTATAAQIQFCRGPLNGSEVLGLTPKRSSLTVWRCTPVIGDQQGLCCLATYVMGRHGVAIAGSASQHQLEVLRSVLFDMKLGDASLLSGHYPSFVRTGPAIVVRLSVLSRHVSQRRRACCRDSVDLADNPQLQSRN